MPVFYTPPEKIYGETLELTGSECHHVGRVMRLKKGDVIVVVDGAGNGYKVGIERISPKKIDCNIISRIRRLGEPLYQVTLVVGLSTGYKIDEVIRQTTELGVVRFIPVITEKSKVKIDDEKRQKARLTRWQKVAVAAVKQSGRSFFPSVEPIIDYQDVFSRYSDLGEKIIFSPEPASIPLEGLKHADDERIFSVFVGPESGFTGEEIELARANGCTVATLGKRILRSENASVVVVALLMHILGELR
jgi:16S rRNA (uracil1498-N3)-methyltransferase